jgi:site-specific DNA-methyltransferase (adenine-specific)
MRLQPTNRNPNSPTANAKSRQRQAKKRNAPANKPPRRRGPDHGKMVSRATERDKAAPKNGVRPTAADNVLRRTALPGLDHGLTYHAASLLFPMMDENELQVLAEDIKESGQNQPVVLHGKVVLDGKNILAACKLAGVQPRFAQWEGTGSPTVWIVSQNLNRRHLSSSQRAVIALKLLPIFKSEARDRQHHLAKSFAEPTAKGKASKNAADLVKSNSRYIEAAKAIERDAPELIETIRNGTLNIPEATALAKLPVAGRQAVVQKLSTGQPRKLKRLIREAELDAIKEQTFDSKPCKLKGDIELHRGDCLNVMPKRLAGQSISVVMTSPVYNFNVRYSAYKDNLSSQEYLGWLEQVFQEIKRVLRDDGSFFLNVGSSRAEPWNAMKTAEVAGKFFTLQNEIIWVKAITVDGTSHGNFRPISGNRYLNHAFEPVYHFTKTGKVPLDRLAVGVSYEDESNLVRYKTAGNRRCGGDVWFIPYETMKSQSDNGFHPAVFPVELARRCIQLAGVKENTVVLDPFVGTGTTLLACQELGVKGIGIDIDPAYCSYARKRLGIGKQMDR